MESVTSENRVSSRRVGDEERQKTAEILASHHAHGRLSQEEFEDRLGAALTARTSAELGLLLADLPVRLDVEVAEPRPAPVGNWPKRLVHKRWVRRLAAVTGAVGGVGLLSMYTDAVSATYHSTNETFLAAFGTGLFGLVAGGVMGWWFRRGRKADDERDFG